jgi:hypothetical protein
MVSRFPGTTKICKYVLPDYIRKASYAKQTDTELVRKLQVSRGWPKGG